MGSGCTTKSRLCFARVTALCLAQGVIGKMSLIRSWPGVQLGEVPQGLHWPWPVHFSYKDHVTNKEVHAKIQQAIGPHKDLLTIIKRRKLQSYGHVSCSSGLAKTILQGTVKGGRRWDRQRNRWEDNIREWTGLKFGKSQRAVKNREKWRKLVAKYLWCPSDPRS